ncbi:MAG: KdsC family phosphatase [Planctomycetota bacterium]|jgi:YrbI family 3-deoxy-D-manno-octulosonate 8-phosphate phosphatase
MTKPPPNLETLSRIRLLLSDVDGVLTNGHIQFDGSGCELKTFHVHDGAGFVYWHRSGGLSGFISGRSSKIVEARAEELGIHEVFLGTRDKREVMEDILERREVAADEVAYVGDDLLDLPVMRSVQFAVAPQDARREVIDVAHYVTEASGGRGVIREVVELLLKAQGRWEALVEKGGRP